MTPKVDTTMSKLASAKPSASASASLNSTDKPSPAARCSQRDIAVSGGDVENLLSRAQIEGFAQVFTDDLQRRADDGIVAGRPRGMLAKLQRSEIGPAGLGLLDGRRWRHDYSFLDSAGSDAFLESGAVADAVTCQRMARTYSVRWMAI